MRIQPIFSSAPLPASEVPDLAFTVPPARRPPFPRLVETAAEVLWAILLFLIIGFFLSKAPAISAVFDEAAAALHRGGEPDPRANDAEIQDLELRLTGDELKLRTLERGYVQLKQRHAELLRAYAEAIDARKPVRAGAPPLAAARTRK